MRNSLYVVVITLCLPFVSFRAYAQEHLPQDSIRLRQLLEEAIIGTPQIEGSKRWLDFDYTLPTTPTTIIKKDSIRLTLRPYGYGTPYDWDPINQCRLVKKSDGSWQPEGSAPSMNARAFTPSKTNEIAAPPQSIGTDLMYIFTKEFWQFQRRKNKKKLGGVLDAYATQ
ncbi:MAG: DUF4858 domain-containing protein [Bacteroides sp.]|nr:DUF4858 domain-containing protein [Bacteroides sp.]